MGKPTVRLRWQATVLAYWVGRGLLRLGWLDAAVAAVVYHEHYLGCVETRARRVGVKLE